MVVLLDEDAVVAAVAVAISSFLFLDTVGIAASVLPVVTVAVLHVVANVFLPGFYHACYCD